VQTFLHIWSFVVEFVGTYIIQSLDFVPKKGMSKNYKIKSFLFYLNSLVLPNKTKTSTVMNHKPSEPPLCDAVPREVTVPWSTGMNGVQLATETYCTFQEKGPGTRRRLWKEMIFLSKVFSSCHNPSVWSVEIFLPRFPSSWDKERGYEEMFFFPAKSSSPTSKFVPTIGWFFESWVD